MTDPVEQLDEYGVGFMPVGGFSSATKVHNLADDDDGRVLIVLYAATMCG
jgi:hypothetical protein